MTDGTRARPSRPAGVSKPKKAALARSKGFASRNQRLPESPPLSAGPAGPGLMAAVRARYRDAVDLLFGSPPRVLNASCTAVIRAAPAAHAPLPPPARRPERRYPKRRRSPDRSGSITDETDDVSDGHKPPASDQVVPEGVMAPAVVRQGEGCESSGTCKCFDSLWEVGGIGPELMLRTAEELSERILMLYGKAVDPETSNVDYSSLVHSSDFHQYLLSARKLRYFDPLLLNDVERKAFFLNVYNSLMIHAIAVMSKPRTMFERVSLYNTAAYDIGGRPYSLNMIEHGVLRSNRKGSGPFAQAPFSETDARKLCMLPSVDPRIHFALNCGARSCPAVRFYEAENLDATLDAATRAYLQDMEVNYAKQTITLPKLLQWYKSDFSPDGDVDVLIKWTLKYVDAEKRKHISSLLLEKEQGVRTFKVVYAGYDWTVNDASP